MRKTLCLSHPTLNTRHRWVLPLIKRAGVAFLPLKLPPARIWSTAPQGQQPAASASSIDEHLEACIGVCEHALGIKLGGANSGKAHLKHQDGSTVCHRLIVHNLFALEGFHIAEALGVPSVVVSSCLPYPPPASFQTRFKAAYPCLWNALQHQGEGVRWAEIEHWMWPLFTERWGAWRQERLCLPAVPYQTASSLPAAPLLLVCLSPCLMDQPSTWPPSIRVCGSIKPAECGALVRKGQRWPGKDATQEKISWQQGNLFGKMASAETVEYAGSTVKSMQDRDVQGSASAEYDHKNKSMSESPSIRETESTQTLKAADRSSAPLKRPRLYEFPLDICSVPDLTDIDVSLICIDFGSMGSMGLLGNAKQLVEILALALKQSAVCGVLLTGQWDALMDAHMELCEHNDCTTLAAVRGFVDHAQLFSRCSALVHHGGAGTVASALRAGLPSVVCPLQFDQFMWADKLEHMGLGKVLPGKIFRESSVDAAGAELSAALSGLIGSHALRNNCLYMQRQMAAEDGIAAAADHIRQLLGVHFEVRPVQMQEGLVCMPNGWEVHASSPSEVEFLYREIFEEQSYLQYGITVQDGDIVVDVGANIGLFTLQLLSRGPGKQPSHIWAIEPLKPTVCQLRSNIAVFGAEKQVTVVPMALGRTATTKDFTYYPRMPGNTTSKPVEKAALQEGCMDASYFEHASTHACQVTTLDDLMRQHAIIKIDLLKVDVEGDEEEVLMGMTQWEAVAQVVAEVHDVDGRPERVKDLLESRGFLVVVDQGSAPSAVMLYAAKEGRLLGELEEAL
ncbi:probable sterol 3-beta-glucosyltransferase at C-terminar half [Coccomyxa sp. Obi]|nr:probable sterol 3-beta-glucosyltransferase at C-terminar half [Coccomyxa sp. Obi]